MKPFNDERTSQVEENAAKLLAARVFKKSKPNIAELRQTAEASIKIQRKRRLRMTAATFPMLSDVQRLCLGLRRMPKAERAFRRECVEAGIRLTKHSSLESAAMRLFYGTSRSLAHKYATAIRGANLLEIEPKSLSKRVDQDRPAKRLTIKGLTDAFRGARPKEESSKSQAPRLKWQTEALERFRNLEPLEDAILCLVTISDKANVIVSATVSLAEAKAHLIGAARRGQIQADRTAIGGQHQRVDVQRHRPDRR